MAPRTRHVSQPLNRTERFELRLLRALGVRPFRRLLFSLERFRHRKDGQVNPNYHMRTVSSGGAEAFEGYLLYHDLLHGVSLAILAAILAAKAVCALPWNAMDVLEAVMCALNVWCLMLQRYNRLRLRQLRQTARQRREKRLRRRTEKTLSALSSFGALPGEDLALVQRLLTALSAGEIACLEADSVPGLYRLASLMDAAEPGRGAPAKDARRQASLLPANLLAKTLEARPYSRVELWVDRLGRRLAPRRSPLLSPCAVVTGDRLAEEAFSALFRQAGPEEIRETLMLLASVLPRLPAKGGAEDG